MSLLSYEDTRKLAELHRWLADLDAEIDQVKDMLGQLANDQCLVRIHFSLNNMDEAKRRRQERRANRLTNGAAEPAEANNFTGEKLPYEKKDGHTRAVNIFRESSAIRILSQILREKEAEHRVLLTEMRDIVSKSEVPTLNPTQYYEHI